MQQREVVFEYQHNSKGAARMMHMKQLAVIGAQQEYRRLKAELETLMKHFPDVAETRRRRSSRRATRKTEIQPVAAFSTSAPRTNSPTWSPAARRAVSERMKKYWAARRRMDKLESKRATTPRSGKGRSNGPATVEAPSLKVKANAG